jgi:hypothetical protein
MAVKVNCNCVGMIDYDMIEEHSEFKSGEPVFCGQLKSEPLEGCLKGIQDKLIMWLPVLMFGSRWSP